MSMRTTSKAGWTMPAVDEKALWGKVAALSLPSGYDIKIGTGGNDVMNGTDAGMDGFDARGGNDIIDGKGGMDFVMGGAGNDMITLGAELDVVYFNTKLNARTNVDRIIDFKSGEDQIGLAKSIFKKAGSNVLKKSAFWTGNKAHDKDDRIIYDKKTGSLYYDPDGTGSLAQTKFASLANKAALSHKDLWIA
jgi:Peptidase M10 serralysin C terminal